MMRKRLTRRGQAVVTALYAALFTFCLLFVYFASSLLTVDSSLEDRENTVEWHNFDIKEPPEAPDPEPTLEPLQESWPTRNDFLCSIPFSADSDAVTDESRDILAKAVQSNDAQYLLVGHCAAAYEEETPYLRQTRMEISQSRAVNVMEAMKELGIPEENIDVQFVGADEPAADNSSEQGRAKNRRVDVFQLVLLECKRTN